MLTSCPKGEQQLSLIIKLLTQPEGGITHCSLKLYVNLKIYEIINVKQILKVRKFSIWPPQRDGDLLFATAASFCLGTWGHFGDSCLKGILGLGFEFKHTCTLE